MFSSIGKRSLSDFNLFFLLFFLQIPSLRNIFKNVPYPLISGLIYILVFSFMFFQIFKNDKIHYYITNYYSKFYISLILITIFLIANYFIFPITLDIAAERGTGSCAHLAIIEPIKSLLSGNRLYDANIGAPISPGPGWILLNFIFALDGLYFLMTPFYFFLFTVIYYKIYKNSVITNLLLTFLSTSVNFWTNMCSGHDLVAVGICLLLLLILTDYFTKTENKFFWTLIPITVILCSSRFFFFFIPFILFLFIRTRNKKLGNYFIIFTTILLFILHFIFFITSDYYQPLHLYHTGVINVGTAVIIIGALSFLVCYVHAFRKIDNSLQSWSKYYSILLGIFFATVALGEIIFVSFNFSTWEGANYLITGAPVVCFYFLKKTELIIK